MEIIRGDEPSLSKLDKLDDYHENDIASALEFLESDERRRLYSLLGVDKVSDIFSYIDDPVDYIEELEPEVDVYKRQVPGICCWWMSSFS